MVELFHLVWMPTGSARLPHPNKPFIVTAMTAEVTSDAESYAFSLNEIYTTVPGKKSM
jgi:hypothetical protein